MIELIVGSHARRRASELTDEIGKARRYTTTEMSQQMMMMFDHLCIFRAEVTSSELLVYHSSSRRCSTSVMPNRYQAIL